MTKTLMTEAAWRAEGERRFGPDLMKWRFKCPICGNVATPEDFRQFKDAGANPNSAVQECIGRYLPKSKCRRAFGEADDDGTARTWRESDERN